MSSQASASVCSECSGGIIDLGDECVCRSCGVVSEKLVVESAPGRKATAVDFTRHSLGGYLGSAEPSVRERSTKGLSGVRSSYSYMKTVSDFAGREEDKGYSCAKLIERVCEKLALPNVVLCEAISVMKRVSAVEGVIQRVTVAGLSAYSIATACKVESVASVTTREIVEAHRSLGRRVKMSTLIRLSIESPIRTAARKPEDYLGRVLGRMARDERLAETLAREGVPQTRYFNELRSLALDLLAAVDEQEKTGHAPCALAAAAAYGAETMMSVRESRNKRFTQKRAAACGDTAEYTLREQFCQIFAPAMSRLSLEPARSPSPQR